MPLFASPTKVIIAWVFLMNVVAFYLFWLDKRRSQAGLYRISESSLLASALWGGSVGALFAQQLLRHKTRKQPFRANLIVISLLHLVVLGFLAWPDVFNRMSAWLFSMASNFRA